MVEHDELKPLEDLSQGEMYALLCRKLDDAMFTMLCIGNMRNIEKLYSIRLFYEKKISEINSAKLK